jgi:L-threonylcarbamoyladenylate synthase
MNNIKLAIQLLKAGKVIAIPTETVYGLAADANNPTAIAKIFKLKKRPANIPLSVLIENNKLLEKWAIDIPEIAYKLTAKFWPGPLTIILKKAPHVNDIVTSGKNTIGLRSPNHPITQKILHLFQGGIAAPSANKFNQPDPINAAQVEKTFGTALDLIIDGGICKIGVASTIVDLTTKIPKILRQGSLTTELLKLLSPATELMHDRLN